MNKELKDKVEEVLTRSIDTIYPTKEDLEKLLLSGKKLRVYMGIDPTATYVHLGHATNYIILKRLHELGHKIIVLIGDFTAMIGDPSDKSAARQRLTKEDVQNNFKTFKQQIGKILDFNNQENPIEIRFNSEWLSKLTLSEVVELASHFTVQRMLERDNFEKRWFGILECPKCKKKFVDKYTTKYSGQNVFKEEPEIDVFNHRTVRYRLTCPYCNNEFDREECYSEQPKPIYVHEFFYPLMQGYDSVALEADVEIGGTDQTFNMLAGRTLVKSYQSREKIVVTTTLLENPVTGEKLMSKSLGTGIGLDEPAQEMYGKTMRLPDEAIIQCFIDCTYLSLKEIKNLEEQLKNGSNPRELKARLAKEIVTIYHSAKEAEATEEEFNKMFRDKERPSEIEKKIVAHKAWLIADLLVELRLASSKAEAQRLVSQGGVRVDEEVLADWRTPLTTKAGMIIQVGKRKWVEIV